ncbi:MAG: AAA family ATPase [Proteobacteria bacterium]|nr:AAA family ATPase [Pseudomonadota bacterium]
MEPNQLEALLEQARQEAVRRRNYYTTTEHLVFVLLKDNEIQTSMSDLEMSVEFMASQLNHFFSQALEKAPDNTPEKELGVPTDALKQLISRVVVQALNSGRSFPRSIDFFIAMADLQNTFTHAMFKAIGLKSLDLMRWAAENPVSQGQASQDEEDDLDPILFNEEDQDSEEMEEDGDEEGDEEGDEGNQSLALSRMKNYLTRLVELAKNGKIDPVIGRDKEINICCQALMRRTKCNVLIVGEAGVGKTAIVEGLALKIANGEVPNDLYGTEIYAIDVPSIVAGTKFRGEMEGRLKAIIKFVKKQKKAILFIDEMHNATGTDKGSGSQEILALLKPELAKGSLRLIGTTTYEDFRRVLSSDSALIRRFHKLDLEEPDEETTRRILHELAPHYEEFHRVRYADDAIDEAVKLAGRYLPDKRFPDKAIDVIDEAGAANRMKPVGEQNAEITVAQIEETITSIARIPELHVSSDESVQLRDAESRLKSLVFGQDDAIQNIVKLVKLSRAGIRAPNKPVASLLFAGPTGVGKTELSKQLANVLQIPFVRFDMSEYREEYTVSKFIGSAPGYVGYERGGLLTEAIRAKPHCVLLLDEIEKAHPSIYDLLLQVMDAAHLTDNTGKTADFRNVILIMTSNAGSEDMSRNRIGFGQEIDVSQGMKEIERVFSPEFRNRLDEIVMFNALTEDSMVRIVDRMVGELEAQIAEKDVHLTLTDDARQWLAHQGFDPKFGARPMARLIQKEISVPLSEEILFGFAKNGAEVEISLNTEGDGLCLQKK